jgi:hypothetical protein
MAQDEGCFGRISQPTRCWAPPGIRPQAPYQVVREYVSVSWAVERAQAEMPALILPAADTALMNLFLEHVSQTFSKSFIVMQVDGAGWHHSDELLIPSTIRLITQPPSSPQVNPVEHGCRRRAGKTLWEPGLPLARRLDRGALPGTQ